MSEDREMSVVVPVRLAPETAVSTLHALLDRQGLEVIAVVSTEDPSALLLHQLKTQRPALEVVEVPGACSVPQLRAQGIRRARGRLVAITEDHCSFSEPWPAALAPSLDNPKVGAAGGPVINGCRGGIVEWVIYFSRYAMAMPPASRGAAKSLTGCNACYRRELLESLQDIYRDGFWEHEVHQELLARGMRLWLEPDASVAHGKRYGLIRYCTLRFQHGRCFAARRFPTLEFWALQARILLSPLTPLLLLYRAGRAVFSKRQRRWEFLACSPLLLLLYAAWVVGELSGYLFGPGGSCSQTD